jgi:hypothetical protein
MVAHWFNSNSSAVTATATVVIAWASLVSSRLFRLEKRIEQANRMPILTFVEEITGDYRSVYIKNAGYGPALNIVRKVIEPGRFLSTTPQEVLIIGTLGPAEKAFAYIATQGMSSVSVLDQPEFHALIECDDVVDGHYEFVYRDRTLSKPLAIAKRKMPPSQADRL